MESSLLVSYYLPSSNCIRNKALNIHFIFIKKKFYMKYIVKMLKHKTLVN